MYRNIFIVQYQLGIIFCDVIREEKRLILFARFPCIPLFCHSFHYDRANPVMGHIFRLGWVTPDGRRAENKTLAPGLRRSERITPCPEFTRILGSANENADRRRGCFMHPRGAVATGADDCTKRNS